MALLHEEEGAHNHEDKMNKKAQRTEKLQNQQRHISLVSLKLWQIWL